MTVGELQELLDKYDKNKLVFMDKNGSVYTHITGVKLRDLWFSNTNTSCVVLDYNPLMCI